MNVVVIVVDTLRADHLGCYGYGRDTSPNLDAFAKEAVVFERVFANAIPTHPSFVTMNTGQYPVTHGVVAHGGDVDVPRRSPWLPSLMQKAGRTTCAVDNLADWLHGFGRGYEFYVDPTQRRTLSINCDNREINLRAIPWLEHYAGESFYMMIHYWDPHTPYMPPRAYRTLFYKGDPHDPGYHSLDRFAEHPLGKAWLETWFGKLSKKPITDAEYIASLYDAEIRYCDEGIGQLLKALDNLGLADNTMVVFTSDHGELMYRHGIFFDHHGLYDGVLHVPLMIRFPGIEPKRVSAMAGSVDFAPSILDLCGIAIPDEMEGHSLAPFMRGDASATGRDFIVSEECTWQMKWCLRTERHKMIVAREQDFYGTPMRELYDLEEDPQELRNLLNEQPDVAIDLNARLEGWIAEKMVGNGLTQDPLVAHGLSLGKQWKG